jgi:predicted lipid-binding transport protein (Tim44 family)
VGAISFTGESTGGTTTSGATTPPTSSAPASSAASGAGATPTTAASAPSSASQSSSSLASTGPGPHLWLIALMGLVILFLGGLVYALEDLRHGRLMAALPHGIIRFSTRRDQASEVGHQVKPDSAPAEKDLISTSPAAQPPRGTEVLWLTSELRQSRGEF